MKTNFTLRSFIKFRLFLVIILLINCLTLASQTKNVSVDYQRNTPRHTKSFMLGYHYGANSENPSFLSQALLFNYNSTKFKMGVSSEFPFFKPSGSDSIKLQNIKSLFRNTELSFNFGLWNKVKEENIKVEYYEGSNKWKVNVPVNYYRTRGIHTGLSSLNTYVEIKNSFYDYNKTTLFFGYFWAKQSNYAFRVDNRNRSGIRYHESYFDLFYAPSSSDQFIKNNTNYLPFGFRFGSNVYSQRNLGFNFKFEIGVMPKNYDENLNSTAKFLYLKSGIGINLAYRMVGKPIEKDFDLGSSSYTGGNKSSSNVIKLIEQGSVYYKAENYKMAILKFEEALKGISVPTKQHATMFYELGDSYFNPNYALDFFLILQS